MANATPTPPSVEAFNSKIADLLKAAKPTELTEILQHPSSLLRSALADNQNQNGKSRE
jgi:hypothetical protein